jgi:F-box/WD-40 domain protein MET30
MASPLQAFLPLDKETFRFSPSSPPGAHSVLSAGLPPFPTFLSTSPPTASQSTVSPSLYSPDNLAATASLSESISHLSSRSPLRLDDAMVGILEEEKRKGTPQVEHSEMDVEDELRRGPPASDTPGGDCRNVCIRHARMANGSTNLMLQKVRFLPPRPA